MAVPRGRRVGGCSRAKESPNHCESRPALGWAVRRRQGLVMVELTEKTGRPETPQICFSGLEDGGRGSRRVGGVKGQICRRGDAGGQGSNVIGRWKPRQALAEASERSDDTKSVQIYRGWCHERVSREMVEISLLSRGC